MSEVTKRRLQGTTGATHYKKGAPCGVGLSEMRTFRSNDKQSAFIDIDVGS
jgi:hypothetical protein